MLTSCINEPAQLLGPIWWTMSAVPAKSRHFVSHKLISCALISLMLDVLSLMLDVPPPSPCLMLDALSWCYLFHAGCTNGFFFRDLSQRPPSRIRTGRPRHSWASEYWCLAITCAIPKMKFFAKGTSEIWGAMLHCFIDNVAAQAAGDLSSNSEVVLLNRVHNGCELLGNLRNGVCT